jgi:hypothetical protein
MSKVNRALKDRLLRNWPANPCATLPLSVMPETEREFMDQTLQDEDLDDDEYNHL